MKQTISRIFVDPRKADGTVRELRLMGIAAFEISVRPMRLRETRSFATTAADQMEQGQLITANVDTEDAGRVEATLIRNGGLAEDLSEDVRRESQVSRREGGRP